MEKNLPRYTLLIDESVDSEFEVDVVSLVDAPAIQRDFLAFNEQKALSLDFTDINEDEHIVVGPAMIPDLPIYRRSDDMGEFEVVFSKETVLQIAEKFYKKNFQNNANIMHQEGQMVEGVTYFLSFIRDTKKGMVGMAGDYPEGTWFLGARVNNPEVWADIKAGKIKGFSVEGLFKYKQPEKYSAVSELEAELGPEKAKAFISIIKKLGFKSDF